MRLSKLQKYILEKCYNYKSMAPTDFYDFYVSPSAAPLQMGHIRIKSTRSGGRMVGEKKILDKKLVQSIIHKSLDSLIAKDFLTAIGKKTSQKWFIYKIKLTNLGRKTAIEIIKNRQRKLPIK
ncbi:MAG: hypothetical protein PHS62_04435 [Patescibacteria group bacterium]|nr:hypothetical protein [Patescibacteria group bacterium]